MEGKENMPNTICTVVDSNSVKEFISSLNKYGECIDYNNSSERSRARKGIFVGIVNKVYEVIPKGKGGHSEHETLFISAKSLINSKRESRPLRIGFTGRIVHLLLDANLKQGDAVGILKPTFFYALHIPSLNAGTNNVVVWIGKQLKDIQIRVDMDRALSENESHNRLNKQKNPIQNIVLEEDSECQSIEGTSMVSSETLSRNVKIYRSKPVELNKISSKLSSNNQIIPDSTTKSIIQGCQNKILDKNKESVEIELLENIISQNTANDGSAVSPVGDKNVTNHCSINCDSHLRCTHRDSCCPHENCGIHNCNNSSSHVVSCDHKCHMNLNCCICQKISGNFMLEKHSCSSCFHRQHCLCNRSTCCGHNAVSHFRCCNSSHTCHYESCSSCRHMEHSCKFCCRASHSQLSSSICCSNDIRCSDRQNQCLKFKKCLRSNRVDKKSCTSSKHSCHECITKYQCCNTQRRTNNVGNVLLHCCGLETKLNEQTPIQNPNDFHKEINSVISEDSHINRTKEWIHNWTQNPPCLQLHSEKSESEFSNLNFCIPSSCSESGRKTIELNKKDINEKKEVSTDSIIPSLPLCSNSSGVKKSNEPIKKKKLFTPTYSSTIISDLSFYNNSTIVEESPPFSSENPTENTPVDVLSSKKYPSVNLPSPKEIIDNNDVNANRSDTCVIHAIGRSDEQPTGNESLTLIETESHLIETAAVSHVNSFHENNTEEVLINQTELPDLEKNQIASEEQFLELRIDAPVTFNSYIQIQTDESAHETGDQGSNSNHKESNKPQNKDNPNLTNALHFEKEHCEIVTSKKILNLVETTNSSKIDEMIVNHDNVNIVNDEIINEKTLSQLESSEISQKLVKSDKNLLLTVDSVNNKNDRPFSSNLRLSLSDHPKLKIVACDNNETSDMELTTIPERSEKGEKRSHKEVLDDKCELMELTCESTLMKRRKMEYSKSIKGKKIGPESIKSNASVNSNITNSSVSSSGTFFDARSNGTNSENSKNWCLKSIEDAFENENILSLTENLKKLGLKSCISYKFSLFSSFEVVGTIINVIPNLSQGNYKSIVKGYCNDRCTKEFMYNDFSEMKESNEFCYHCRQYFHIVCPACLKDGLRHLLCLYYSFEIHLLDGKNVLRIEVERENGTNFIGCSPQLYLKSNKPGKKFFKLVAYTSPTKWTHTILLKAKIKVKSKNGHPTLTLEETSLKKDLTLHGKRYRL